jgi:hydroxymethylbilane synthase
MEEGQYDAVVLAAAGLKRLGWAEKIAEILPVSVMCSAVGQGALAIETAEVGQAACAELDHFPSRVAVTAERGVLAALGGGCQVPIGAHATVSGGRLHVLGVVISPDGAEYVRAEAEGPSRDAERVGRHLGAELLDSGARAILEKVYQA